MTEKEYLIDCIRRIHLDYKKQVEPYVKRLERIVNVEQHCTANFPAVQAAWRAVDKQAEYYFDMMEKNK